MFFRSCRLVCTEQGHSIAPDVYSLSCASDAVDFSEIRTRSHRCSRGFLSVTGSRGFQPAYTRTPLSLANRNKPPVPVISRSSSAPLHVSQRISTHPSAIDSRQYFHARTHWETGEFSLHVSMYRAETCHCLFIQRSRTSSNPNC